MIRSKGIVRVILTGSVTMVLSLPAMAYQVSGRLGQALPQTANLSKAPGYRVYEFIQYGVKFIQVNNLAGQVLTAIASANGQVLTLPMGIDPAPRIASAVDGKPVPGVTVYNDGTVTLSVAVDEERATQWTVTPQLRMWALEQCGKCGDPSASASLL